MSKFSANTETLLILAWLASSPDFYGSVIQKNQEEVRRYHSDNVKMITSLLDEELGAVCWDSVCGPVYERLLQHSIARVDLDILTWAIRGEQGVCFKENYRYSNPDKAKEEEAERSETAVLWAAVATNERLLSKLQRMSKEWHGDIRRGAQVLWTFFRLHTPLLIRSTTSSFLILELLLFGLEHVDWCEVAASLLGVPYVSGSVQPEDPQDRIVLLATLKEFIWQGYNTFGEFSREDDFAEQLQELCLKLADQCYQANREISTLEESGSVYTE